MLECVLVQRPHDRRARGARHPAIAIVGVGPLADARIERYSRDRSRLQDVDRSVLHRELDVLRRAEVTLNAARDALDFWTVLPQQRMIRVERRAMPGQQGVAEPLAGFDDDFLR